MERADWTLLAISLATGRGLSPVQLQKAIFILSKGLPEELGPDFYNFVPYNYGPFDKTIYNDAELLSFRGLVSITNTGAGYSEYAVTPAGQAQAELLKARAPKRAFEYLGKTIKWVQALSFSSLVRAIYSKYPEYRVNSVFQG